MGLITCLDCKKSVYRSGGLALRCTHCAGKKHPRIADPGRVRNGIYKPLKLDGRWVCLECHAPVQPDYPPGQGRRPSLRCSPCNVKRHLLVRQIRGGVALVVARAVIAGQIPKAATQLCTDCGKPATCYDHRDYTEPLKVEPVCRSCNIMRGPADFWPLPATPADSTAKA